MKVLDEAHGERWSLYNGDSVRAIAGIPDASVGLCVFSPPFESMFTYSPALEDMGNCDDSGEFFEHFRYLIPELLRVTKPGRLCVVHCKDILASKTHHGYIGLRDFPGGIVGAFDAAGWVYHSRVTIWKDPVTEMQRTNNIGLLYKQASKDTSYSRQGTPDYLMVFRNQSGDYADPVRSDGERFARYVGMEPPDCDAEMWMTRDGKKARPEGFRRVAPKDGRWPTHCPFEPGTEAARVWSIAVWQRYASPVWMDIDQSDTLNFRIARSDADQKHMCPLQMQVVERCVELWTNPGDVVFSPFAGIGSEPYGAVRCGRRGLGMELKPEYFRWGCRFLAGLEEEMSRPSLFAGIEAEGVTA
jgi:DNA modification methylase